MRFVRKEKSFLSWRKASNPQKSDSIKYSWKPVPKTKRARSELGVVSMDL